MYQPDREIEALLVAYQQDVKPALEEGKNDLAHLAMAAANEIVVTQPRNHPEHMLLDLRIRIAAKLLERKLETKDPASIEEVKRNMDACLAYIS